MGYNHCVSSCATLGINRSWSHPAQMIQMRAQDVPAYPTPGVAILNHFLECHDSRIPVPFEGKTFQTGESRPTQIKNTHTQKHGNWGMASATPLKSAVVFFFQREVFCCGITPLAWDGFAEDGDCSVQKKHLRPLGLLWKCKPPTILNNHIVFNIIFSLYRAIGGNYTVPQFGTNPVESDKANMDQHWGTMGYQRGKHQGVLLWQPATLVLVGHLDPYPSYLQQSTSHKFSALIDFDTPSTNTSYLKECDQHAILLRGKNKPTPPNLHTWHFDTRFNHFFNSMLSMPSLQGLELSWM